MIAKLLINNFSLVIHWNACRCKAIIAKLHQFLKFLTHNLNTGQDLNLSFVRQDRLVLTTYSFSNRSQTWTSFLANTKSKTWQRMKKQKNLSTFLVDWPQMRKNSRLVKNGSLPWPKKLTQRTTSLSLQCSTVPWSLRMIGSNLLRLSDLMSWLIFLPKTPSCRWKRKRKKLLLPTMMT